MFVGAVAGLSGMTSDLVGALLATGRCCKVCVWGVREPDGGVWGIIVGDIIRRLVARTIAKQIARQAEEATAPHQCALNTKAGRVFELWGDQSSLVRKSSEHDILFAESRRWKISNQGGCFCLMWGHAGEFLFAGQSDQI